jgi:penicillin-binding protein 1C
MNEALVRSLNLPAVQVLEAYGPRICCHAAQCGVAAEIAGRRGAEPVTYSGGAGARLADITAAYSAFARHGKAGQLRFQPDDPLMERTLMSPGAAWIIRRILAGKRSPAGQRAPASGAAGLENRHQLRLS